MAKRITNEDDLLPLITEFKGINNVDAEESLELGELRTATNVDIDDKSRVRRRSGSSSIYASDGCHSGWSDGANALFMEGGTLNELNTDLSVTAIATGLQTDRAMSYLDVVGRTYYANGVDKGFVESGVAYNWGVPVPTAIPDVAVVSGALHPGKYGITLTYVRDDGSESGAPGAYFFETIDNPFGITLTNISTIAEAAKVRIYMTAANGDTFYLADEILAGVDTRTITSAPLVVPLRSYLVTPPPAGSLIEYHKSRVFVADGKIICFSDAFSHEWFKPHEWFFRMTEDVTLLGAVEEGMFVSADKTYFISFKDSAGRRVGGLGESAIITKAPYKAIKGTMVRVPGSVVDPQLGETPVLIWRSEQGICLGGSNGQFINLTESRYADNIDASEGAGLFRRADGASQYISTAKNSSKSPSQFAATDVAVAEVIRNGIIID